MHEKLLSRLLCGTVVTIWGNAYWGQLMVNNFSVTLELLRALADASILVGVSLIPIIPFLGEDENTIDDVIRAAKDHGAKFVIGAGMTVSGVQAEKTLETVKELDPKIEAKWREMYNWDASAKRLSSPPMSYTRKIGLRVREIAVRNDIPDRMPRYIPEGRLGINKRIAELLFLRTYDLELEGAICQRIWAYRKAALTVDELSTSVADIFASDGFSGLQALPTIGEQLANLIGSRLQSIENTAASRIDDERRR